MTTACLATRLADSRWHLVGDTGDFVLTLHHLEAALDWRWGHHNAAWPPRSSSLAACHVFWPGSVLQLRSFRSVVFRSHLLFPALCAYTVRPLIVHTLSLDSWKLIRDSKRLTSRTCKGREDCRYYQDLTAYTIRGSRCRPVAERAKQYACWLRLQ